MSAMYYYLQSMVRQIAGVKKRRYEIMDERWGKMIGFGYEKDCVWMHYYRLGNVDLTIRMKGTSSGPDEKDNERLWNFWSVVKENEGDFICAFQQLFSRLNCEFSNEVLGEMEVSLSSLENELCLSSDKFFAIIQTDGTIHLDVRLTTNMRTPTEIGVTF